MRTGSYDESLALLADEPPPALARSVVAVRRKLTQCGAFSFLGRYAEASKALAAAQQLIAQDHPELAGEAALRQGTLAFLQGDLPKAQTAFRSTLAAAQKQKDPFLEIAGLGSLGMLAVRQEHYDESVDLNKRALALAQNVNDRNSLARIEGNIGWGYHSVGDLQNALEQFQKAAKSAELADLKADHAYWSLMTGTVEFDLGILPAAESHMTSAMKLADQLHDSTTAIESHENLAILAMRKGQFTAARDQLNQAEKANADSSDLKHSQYNQLLSAQLALQENHLDAAAHSLGLLTSDASAPTSLRWEALATLAQVHAAQKKNQLAEREFSRAIATISNAQDSVGQEEFRLSFLSTAIRFYDQYLNFLLSQKRPIDALKIADLSRAQTLERGLSRAQKSKAMDPLYNHGASPQDIAHRQNATLLFYWLGETRSYLWVITTSKTELLPLPASAEIDATVTAYRESFLDSRDPLEYGNADGQKLYDVLIRPAGKFIPKNSRVVILPTGSLTGLNFETLIASDPQPHYWIQDVTISVGNSLALLARSNREPPPKSGNLLFFGDAISASTEFPALPDSRKEADILKKYFPEERRTFFTGANATPSQYLKSSPGQYSYIHFATHGIASSLRPLESAIILSPEGDSFKLYARDIIQRPLNAYLVTISACDGAGIRVYAGEGLVGLSWAFFRAGAHNVIAGLWEVSSASTPQLMDDLYKGILAGEDPATALRNAKLSLINSGGIYKRPFYWAPFQLYSGS